jgi:hypothetical protein
MPSICAQTLRRKEAKQLGPLGLGGVARRIPVRPAVRLAGEVGENDQELTTGLLVVDLGLGASPARGYDGDRRW